MIDRICRGPFAAALGLIALGAGCGDGGPPRVTVSGVVTRDGQPLGEAAVQFLPDPAGTAAQPAEALTDAAGTYRLATAGRSGVVPGRYHVVVSKLAPGAAPSDDPFMDQMTTAPGGKGKGKGKAPASPGAGPGPVEAAFDREVPAEGGTFDFEVAPGNGKPAGR